jgi:dihydroorotate dehydrogenase electron transfer subunit
MGQSEVIVENKARPGRYTTAVIENRRLSARYYLLVLARPRGMQDPGPGTFLHVAVPGTNRFFLRRPFSILDCSDDTISMVIVEKGTGTKLMRHIEAGKQMDFIGPLGSSFPRVPGKRVLALAGGVGLGPLYYYWAKRSTDDCESFRLLYGARNSEDLFLDNFAWDRDAVRFSTDDGSHGFAGSVVDSARDVMEDEKIDLVFSCGPNPMLLAAASFAQSAGLLHYVSLENRMGCALGACRACVVPTRAAARVEAGAEDPIVYKTVCKDGPVFEAGAIVWDKLPQA